MNTIRFGPSTSFTISSSGVLGKASTYRKVCNVSAHRLNSGLSAHGVKSDLEGTILDDDFGVIPVTQSSLEFIGFRSRSWYYHS